MATEFIEISEEEYQGVPSDFIEITEEEFNTPQEPVGTSIGQEISQIPAALKQSFGQPLEAMGETAQVAGFPAVATALKGAIQEPEGYVSAGQRFMAPKEGEFQIAGFAPQYAPRAIVEQTGQIVGSIGSRIAGAIAVGGLGALINPSVGVAGAAVGQFAGPALFEAAQIVGPVALERAKNNGYTEPTDKDMAYAVATAASSGLLNAFGAKYLPGGDKAVGSFAKRLAASFLGEGIPEGLQSLVQQVGETVETKNGIQVSPKQAIGEALIGGGAGAAATTIAAPFTPEQIAEAKIAESANKEAENLFIGNDNPQGKAVLANKQKLEQEIADTKQVLQAIESTDPIAQKLKLELKEKEAILAAAQGQVDSIVESTDPVAEAERQQAELAKAITTPAEPTVNQQLTVQPPQAAPVEEVVTPPVEVAPAIAEAAPVEPVTPAPVTEQVAPEEITIEEATDLGYTQRDPSDIRVFKASNITSLTNHLEKQGFREGDVIEAPTGSVELYVSNSGFAYSWKPKKGRGRDGNIKAPVGGVRIEPVTLRDPNAPAMSAKVSKTKPPKGYVKEGGKYVFKAGVTEQPVGAATPAAAPEVAPIEISKKQTREDFENRFLSTEVTVNKNDPRFSKSKEVSVGPGGISNVVQQANLSEVVSEPSVYHESNLDSIRKIVSRISAGPRNIDLWTSNSIDLALGQGGKGYVLELDTKKVNGSIAPSLAAEIQAGVGATGTEIKVNKTAPSAIKSVIVPNNVGLNALRKTTGFEKLFDFDNATQTERGIRIPVKQKATPTVSETIAEPVLEVAPTISESTKRREAIAIESVNTPQKLTRRLQDALDTYGIKNRKSWTLDFENKQLVSPDKTTAIKWTTRYFPNEPESYRNQQTNLGKATLVKYQPTPAVSETITEPVLPRLQREKADTDFASVDEITDIFHESAPAGTDKSESKRIAVNFVKDYINQSIDWVRDTFGSAPDKVGFNAIEMKKWLKDAISVRRVSDDEFTKGIIQKKGSLKQNGEVNISILSPLESRLIALHESSHFLYHLGDAKSIPENVLNSIKNKKLMPDKFPNPSKDIKEKFADAFTNWAFTKMHPEYANEFPAVPQEFVSWIESEAISKPLDYISSVNKIRNQKLTEKESTLTPAAAPTGIAVGNRIKLGRSPQTYTIEEVIPQTETEKANGEQYYSVKNEKTGETQVVEKADMKLVKKPADTRKTVVGDTQYQTEGVIPEDQRFTEDELRVIVNDIFGGKIPDKIEIITDATDPKKEFKAAYNIRKGTITYNLAYISKGDDLSFVTNHELGHFIMGDPKFQVEMARLFDTLPADIQEKLKTAIDEAYAQDGIGVRAEETIVFAFGEILENAPDGRNILQRFLDAIRDAINRLFKTKGYIPRDPKKAAAAILMAARNRFEQGEFIRRPNGSILMMTPTSPKDLMRDAEYLAAVERGDMETAQRMVDEAAKKAGYDSNRPMFHGHKGERFNEFSKEKLGETTNARTASLGFFFSETENVSQQFEGFGENSRKPLRNYLSFNNPIVFESKFVYRNGELLRDRYGRPEIKSDAFDAFWEMVVKMIGKPKSEITSLDIQNLRSSWEKLGYDAIKFNGTYMDSGAQPDNQIVVFNTNQIKSADPVTYDDAGNVIPLSQRFQPSEPDIRRMSVKKGQVDAPIKPEAKTVTEGLVQGIDIGKENNMPINNKIESHIKNFAFVRGIFESASDRLRRAKFTKLATAIDDYYDQAQRRLGFANKILLPAFEEYSKQSKATKAKIDEEVKMFFAAQENKRDTDEFFDELNPITQKIVTSWQKFGEESGKENQRIGIKVYDKGLQRWRPIGRVEKFWPRVLKPEYKRALMEPDKYQKEYNEIVEALMKSGRIETPEEAEVFISEYEGKGGQNDYFSGIEVARGQAFPEELYDYSTQVMTDYVARWAQHSSRIEQFGQKLGENSKTLWDRSRESTRDRRTIDYITAAQERVEGYFPNDPFVKGMSALNIWASGLQLGNPASSMLNFFGGTTLNAMVGQPGAFSSYLSSFVELRKLGRELKDAREKGIVSRDLMNIIGDHQAVLEYNRFAQAGQKTTDFLLKYSGFTPVEQMVRTQSMIIGKSFLRKTLSSLSKNPNSSFSKRSLAWLNRNNIDADKLIVEQGTGPETDKLLRYFANISQGSYTIAQTPIFTDTPIGRFLFKYQKFSTQVMRQSWKNTFEPAWKAVTNKNETLQLPDPTRQLLYRLRLAEAKELGDNRKITLDEIPKKVTKAEGKALTIIPVMMWLGAAYVGGEIILRMRDMLFGVLMKGPSYEDIIRAFENDEDDDELYLALERAWYNLIGVGALGLIGNYAQFFMDWQDRERVKNPLDPPALSIFKETATFIQNAVDQGTITLGDINNYLNRTLSAYRVAQRLYQTAASGLGFSKAPTVAEEMFRRETASLNKYARRWAESAGLEYRTRRPPDLPTSKMTPINRKIASYLQRGEPGAAVAYAKEYLNSIPKKEREKAIQSMESGARFRQPFRLGNGPMNQTEKEAFRKWLKEKVSKEDFDKFQKLDSSYQKTYNLFLKGLPNK